jgi:hypothetical protein
VYARKQAEAVVLVHTMSVHMRPLTKEERRALAAMAKNPITLPDTMGMVAFFSFFTIFPIVILCRIVSFLRPAQPYLIGAVIACWVVYGIRHYSRYKPRYDEAHYSDDLALGMAEVKSFAARDAIRVEEFEDEGSSYYVQLEDGSVLFLSGQYLYEPEEDKEFPCTEFDVIRGPKSRAFLDLVCRGSYLPPSKVLKPFPKDDFKHGRVPEDGQILHVDWSEL